MKHCKCRLRKGVCTGSSSWGQRGQKVKGAGQANKQPGSKGYMTEVQLAWTAVTYCLGCGFKALRTAWPWLAGRPWVPAPAATHSAGRPAVALGWAFGPTGINRNQGWHPLSEREQSRQDWPATVADKGATRLCMRCTAPSARRAVWRVALPPPHPHSPAVPHTTHLPLEHRLPLLAHDALPEGVPRKQALVGGVFEWHSLGFCSAGGRGQAGGGEGHSAAARLRMQHFHERLTAQPWPAGGRKACCATQQLGQPCLSTALPGSRNHV